MSLSLADVKTICDSIAKQAQNIRELGFDINTNGYNNNRTTILAGDIAVAADLAEAFRSNPPANFGSIFDSRLQALNRHLGGLSQYLIGQDSRVHTFLRDYIGWALDTKVLFPAAGLVLATFNVTGAGAGTFTDGVSMAASPGYGKVWLQIRVINGAIGAGSLSATIIGTKLDGSAQSKVVAIPNASAQDTLINVGVLGTDADHYHDITNITVTGGVSGDDFQLETRLERALTL